MRNPSKNACKRLMRRAYSAQFEVEQTFSPENSKFPKPRHYRPAQGRHYVNNPKCYRFFNEIGTRLYIMSKQKICNREPKGYRKHCF